MKTETQISILIPAYNESENINILIEKIKVVFSQSDFKDYYEIIVINDCSNDDSENKIKELIKTNNNLKLINLKVNSGKAYCLDVGIINAKGNIITTIDADNQYDPKDIIKMLKIINSGVDLVNGKRISRKDNFLTLIFSKFYNLIIRSIFRIEMYDFFSGIKVYKKEIYQLMDYSGMPRFIVFFSKKYNFKIKEFEVMHFYRNKGKSSYNLFDKIVLSIQDMFSLIFCVYLSARGVYVLKQAILIIHTLVFLIIMIYSLYFNYFSIFYFYNSILSLIIFSVLYTIINSFLNSKIKKNLNLIKNIFPKVK
ncbi:glycosyltransferase [Pelagibacteraceae bacterium]|nr:glycosyltransferase [Pelagibacteraceae bacterium]